MAELERASGRMEEHLKRVLLAAAHAEEAAADAAEKIKSAEDASRLKSEFFASMAHDLRTPLNAVIGFSELLASGTFGPLGHAKYEGYVQDIQRSSRHLLKLINDLLELSRMEAGKIDLSREEVDLPALIEEIRASIEIAARSNGNQLTMVVDHGMEPLCTDKFRLTQVLINLLGNACKFTRDGSVRLDVTAVRRDGRDSVAFAVTDTGIGITDRQLARIFDPYSQAEQWTAREFGGTGLGLPIARRLAGLMGGFLEVESEIGQGSTFRLVLPARRPDAMPAKAAGEADRLVVALDSPVTTIDPHYHNHSSNQMLTRHVFEALAAHDEQHRLEPRLAVGWENDGALNWVFHLRPGVRFHDGAPFKSADVVASLRRVPDIAGSPGSYSVFTRSIAEVEAIDPLRVRIRTKHPYPSLIRDLVNIGIIRATYAEATHDGFDRLTPAIGTGPYRLNRWTPRDSVVLDANNDYWGEPPRWREVVLRWFPDEREGFSALLRNEVQLIGTASPVALQTVAQHPEISITDGFTNRVTYVQFDCLREETPFAFDHRGRRLTRNPFRDVRVRRAASLAIDRAVLAEDVMGGLATPTAQLLPAGYFGYVPDIPDLPYGLDEARRLLAEAGYPEGFRIVLHGAVRNVAKPNLLLRAIAHMLGTAGIVTEFELIPTEEFYPRATRFEFTAMLATWLSYTGEAWYPLNGLLATHCPEAGTGPSNRGRYSNPELDALLHAALLEFDDAKREDLLRRATRIGLNECGLIPLFHRRGAWAARRGLNYSPRTDGYTLAMGVRRALRSEHEAETGAGAPLVL